MGHPQSDSRDTAGSAQTKRSRAGIPAQPPLPFARKSHGAGDPDRCSPLRRGPCGGLHAGRSGQSNLDQPPFHHPLHRRGRTSVGGRLLDRYREGRTGHPGRRPPATAPYYQMHRGRAGWLRPHAPTKSGRTVAPNCLPAHHPIPDARGHHAFLLRLVLRG